jgi:hypothetical protein
MPRKIVTAIGLMIDASEADIPQNPLDNVLPNGYFVHMHIKPWG